MDDYKKRAKWFFTNIGIFLLYSLGFIIFGESHPFSSFPMYSSFPNWSYVFYFTDKNDIILPLERFNSDGGEIGHKFYSVCASFDFDYGSFQESPSELSEVGKLILEGVDPKYIKLNNIKCLKLKRIGFYYKNDSINERIDLLHEFNY